MTRLAKLPRTSGMAPVMTAVLWGVVSIATGCTPTATGGQTVTPGMGSDTREGSDPVGLQEGDSVPELEKRLERLAGEQAARMDDAMADTQACHDLCSLSASICEVQVKLCDIADRHPQEGSYQELCREGQQECREAQSSCEDCVDEHAGNSTEPPVTEHPGTEPPVSKPPAQ